MRIRWLLLSSSLGLAVVCCGQGGPPTLVQIKAAAEAGDPKAQYEYGKAIPLDRKVERMEWILRSARAGYAPAQEELGDLYASPFFDPDRKNRPANLRESVRWSSRAAYQGVPSAQFRIAGFYQHGEVLPKDRVAAYVWMRTANSNRLFGPSHKSSLDRLITEMSSVEITEAEDRLKTFTLQTDSKLNPVEVDLLFAQCQLGATYVVNGVRQVVVNKVRFSQGETKDLVLAGEPISILCVSIEEKSVLLGIARTPYTRRLKR